MTALYGQGRIAAIITVVLIIIFNQQVVRAQEKILNIPFDASRFDTTQRKADFMPYQGLKVMKIAPSPTRNTIPVTLKNVNFTNGTIEFDAMPQGAYDDEIGINFHQQDIYNYESLYLRVQKDETRQRNDAIQYTPFIHGINLWDIMTPFRGYAPIHNEGWNHIKLVISGWQMLVYINGAVKPTLTISRLEGNARAGSLSFDGEALFTNLIVKPDMTEGLSPNEGADLTDNDPNYLRKWEVTTPQFLEKGQELTEVDLPGDSAGWQPIVAERRGLINLTRRFEGIEFTSYPKRNRYVWLRTTIRSDKKQTTNMQLGFSDEAYVFINKRLLYVDKNRAGELYQKYPHGRIDISNASFDLPLKEGDNELIIGVAADFYGWGLMARMANSGDFFIRN